MIFNISPQKNKNKSILQLFGSVKANKIYSKDDFKKIIKAHVISKVIPMKIGISGECQISQTS